jgi:hypothetical protein
MSFIKSARKLHKTWKSARNLKDTVKNEYARLKYIGAHENSDVHVDNILKYNKRVAAAVQENPHLRYRLHDYVQEALQENKYALYGAKAFDYANEVDRGIEAGTILLGPRAYMVAKKARPAHKALYRANYTALYTGLTRDFKGALYLGIDGLRELRKKNRDSEDLTLVHRVRLRVQEQAADNFLDYVVNQQITPEMRRPRQEHQYAA